MIAAVIVAVTFQPVRARLTRLADRLVYGKRATPYEVLSEFSERVGGAYADDDLLPRMARVLGEGVGAERADVWLAVEDELRDVAMWPPDARGRRVPIPLVDVPARRPSADAIGRSRWSTPASCSACSPCGSRRATRSRRPTRSSSPTSRRRRGSCSGTSV